MDEETNEDSKYSSSRRKSTLARRRPASFPSRKSRAWLAAESRAENTKDKNVAEIRDFIKFPAFHEVPTKAATNAHGCLPHQSAKRATGTNISSNLVELLDDFAYMLLQRITNHTIRAFSVKYPSSASLSLFKCSRAGDPLGEGSTELKNKPKNANNNIMSLTEDCCKPAPPAVDDAVGKEQLVADIPAYVTGSPSASAAVLFISDLFGFGAPLLRRLADKVAKSGYFVVVPDFFQGDPFIGGQGENLFQGLDTWLPKHMPNGSVGDVKKIVEYLHAHGKSSLGASGFCWGAKLVALVGKDDTFNALVQLHPSLAEASDYEEVKPPIAVLASPTDSAEELAAPILGARTDIKSFVKVFPTVFHGWTVRYDENDPDIVAKAEEAHKDMLDWYAKYLPVTATETTTSSSSATTTIPKTIKELLPAKLIE